MSFQGTSRRVTRSTASIRLLIVLSILIISFLSSIDQHHPRRILRKVKDGKDDDDDDVDANRDNVNGGGGSYDDGSISVPHLVIAGELQVAQGLSGESSKATIAHMDLRNTHWSSKHPTLYLYSSNHNQDTGTVYALLSNHTSSRGGGVRTSDGDDDDDGDGRIGGRGGRKNDKKKKGKKSNGGLSNPTYATSHSSPSNNLIVVGAFDTTCKECQTMYCSVGNYDSVQFQKVGEGLCNGALSLGMKITTASMATPQNLFVGGSFTTRVWSGEESDFLKINHLARYNSTTSLWAPLEHGQLGCSWCPATVMALAWDEEDRKLYVGGKFNSIDGANIPAGLAVYDLKQRRLTAMEGGGVTLDNESEDGVVSSLSFDASSRNLYVMGTFEVLTKGKIRCKGIARYDVDNGEWTCLADERYTVDAGMEGNMVVTDSGVMIMGRAEKGSSWKDEDKPYAIARYGKRTRRLGSSARNKDIDEEDDDDDDDDIRDDDAGESGVSDVEEWGWLEGFAGWEKPLHAIVKGFGEYENHIFIGGEDYLAMWSLSPPSAHSSSSSISSSNLEGRTTILLSHPINATSPPPKITGSIMSVAQLNIRKSSNLPPLKPLLPPKSRTSYSVIAAYFLTLGTLVGLALAVLCNRHIWDAVLDRDTKGISLDTLSHTGYGATEDNRRIQVSFEKAMRNRHIKDNPFRIELIDPKEMILERIIGEGTFGRVWKARWRASEVAVKEFVFAQAAVVGKSTQQREIIEEIVGEAGTMSCLRHPHILQLFGCSLTSQAIWIVSEVCSLGSLRQVLDDQDRHLGNKEKLRLAVDVADGMSYLHDKTPAIIHRDLKSHNIFVHGKGGSIVAKIGDWGSARAALAGNRTMTHGVGTACWLSPEVIKHARASKKSDVYGFAIVLWELATREEVYKGLNTMQIIAQVANEGLRPQAPSIEVCPWRNLMVKCWDEDPKERLSFAKLLGELQLLFAEE